MDKIKIGFIGCGYMGQLAHIKNYAALGSCEIAAICDTKVKQAEAVAARYGIPNLYTDYRELLANPDITAVVAAQSFTNHVNIVPEILNAKKHLLTEKPLCMYPENGEKLVQCAADNGVIHMVAYHKRSDPAAEYALDVIKKWKASGEMGNMKYVRITMPPGDWLFDANKTIMTDEQNGAFNEEAFAPGIDESTHKQLFTFVNYYIHQLNFMRYLFGEDYKLTFVDKSRVLLAVESDSGVCGIIEMQPYETSDDWQERAFVSFEKGWIDIEIPPPLITQSAGKVTVFENGTKDGVFITPRLPNICAMSNQAKNFIEAVKGTRKPPCTSAEAVKDLEVALDYIKYINQV